MATTKVRVKCGEFWLEVDAQDVKEAFRGLANYLEVFSESVCGVCQSTAIRPSHRTKDSFDFYELICCQCGAALKLGQSKDQHRLFPKRKDENGNWLENGGWAKYNRQNDFQ